MYKRLGNYKTCFQYIDLKNKSKITDENTLLWIKSLKIPPAYNDVIISTKKNSKILAYGFDSKGRKQCLYHPDFVLYRSKIKFEKILKKAIKVKKKQIKQIELLKPTESESEESEEEVVDELPKEIPKPKKIDPPKPKYRFF